MTSYILSHDLGTTGDKATLFSEDGRLIASSFKEYPTIQPELTWAEQDPSSWWSTFASATKELLKMTKIRPEDVVAIGLSGTMMACLPVDGEGNPLRRSIIWMDQRSIEETRLIKERIGEDNFYRITGNRINPPLSIAKILWLKRNQPKIYEKTRVFLQTKDFVSFKLTGKFATDYSDASLAGLLDVNRRDWAYEMIEEVGISTDKLPELRASVDVLGEVDRKIANQLGLGPKTVVVVGGGDGACATVGAGVVEPGQAYNYIGASSWIATCSEKPLLDPKMRIFTMWHADPDKIVPVGTMQAAGSSYRWLRDEVCQPEVQKAQGLKANPYTVMDSEAERTDPGSNKVLFLPYLMGERAPWWNPNARGVFFGLALGHGRAHLIRAVLEGVAFNLKIVLDALEELGVGIRDIRLIGGGARGRVWREIMANIYGKRVMALELLEEAGSLGAAVVAGVGARLYDSVDVAKDLVRVVAEHEPDPSTHERYSKLYEFFKRLYLTLAPLYDDLASLEI